MNGEDWKTNTADPVSKIMRAHFSISEQLSKRVVRGRRDFRTDRASGLLVALCLLLLLGSTGCQSVLSPISGIPAHRLPPQFLAQPKNNLIPIDVARLRQEPPREYLLDTSDILGIYIEGVLGEIDAMPPFHMPTAESNLPPAIGYPVPVREDGTLPLPLVAPIRVRGLTLTQVENVIRKAYTVDQVVLAEGKDRIFVTLIKEREYAVVVMRRDGEEQSLSNQLVALPAYKNDVLHALAETGGLPGLNAKNEVKIFKGRLMDGRKRDAYVRQFYSSPPSDPCLCYPPLPDDPAIISIPLRLPPGEVPTFNPQDIILESGDVVLIEGREREVFYTGGMLGGGEHPLPRDYDLDVIGAMSMVGGQALSLSGGGGRGGGRGGGGGFGGGGGAGMVGGVAPGQLYIIRKTPCGDQITIAVDMVRALRNPRSRPLIQAGDMLWLQYKPSEEILNFSLGTFFTYGISEVLGGGGRR